MKRLKKWLIAFAVLVAVFLLMGMLPVFKSQISGIENYNPADSTLGLCQRLYPSEDFLSRFQYESGDYEYYYNGVLEDSYAVAFSVLAYTPEEYEAAKEYCFQQFTNTDEHRYQVGDYHFVEHLWQTKETETGEWEIYCDFPEMFNMFAYNDTNHTLLFLGYYEPDGEAETQLALTDFEAFYQQHFSKYYELK